MSRLKLWKKIFWALVFANLMVAIVRALLHPYHDAGHFVPVVPNQQAKNTGEK